MRCDNNTPLKSRLISLFTTTMDSLEIKYNGASKSPRSDLHTHPQPHLHIISYLKRADHEYIKHNTHCIYDLRYNHVSRFWFLYNNGHGHYMDHGPWSVRFMSTFKCLPYIPRVYTGKWSLRM